MVAGAGKARRLIKHIERGCLRIQNSAKDLSTAESLFSALDAGPCRAFTEAIIDDPGGVVNMQMMGMCKPDLADLICLSSKNSTPERRLSLNIAPLC